MSARDEAAAANLAQALHDERVAKNTQQVDCWVCEAVNSPTIKAFVYRVGLAEAILALPRPGVDRGVLDQALSDHEVVWRGEVNERTQQCACGWMPDSWETDDQFDEEYREHRTDAVLALLNERAS